MADEKISDLVGLSGGNLNSISDYFVVVDTSDGSTKKITPHNVFYNTGTTFNGRSELETAIMTTGLSWEDGTILFDGTCFYYYEAGLTDISDIDNVRPVDPSGWCSCLPEHFLEYNETDMTVGLQSAINYCETSFSLDTFGQGGVVGLLARAYKVADNNADGYALTIKGSVSLKGQGENSTQITINDQTDVTLYVGKGVQAILDDTTGVEKVTGVLIQDIQFYNLHSGSAPTAGSHIRVDRSVVHIDRCHLINHYRGVEFLGTPESCKVTDSQITQGSNNGATGFSVVALSAGIAILRRQVNATFGMSAGYQDSTDSLYYIEPNSVYLTNNNIRVGALGTQNGGDYALLVGAVDGLYAANNHFAWGTTACVGLTPQQANMSFTNIAITGGLIDPLPSKSQYGVQANDRFSVGSSVMGSIVLSGLSIAGCVLDGVRLSVQCRRFQMNGGEIKGCGRYGVNIDNLAVTDTIINGVHIYNTDNDATGTEAAVYLASGQRTTISNCAINNSSRGIQVFTAAQRTSILGNKFEAMTSGISIFLQEGADLAACVGNEIEESATLTATGRLYVPIGLDTVYITGAATITEIRSDGSTNSVYSNRVISARFDDEVTLAKYSTAPDNLDIGSDILAEAGDIVTLRWNSDAVDSADSRWEFAALSAAQLTKSRTDVTPKRILRNFAHGLGVGTNSVDLADADAIASSGFTSVNASTVNAASAVTSGILTLPAYGQMCQMQITSNRAAFRRAPTGAGAGTPWNDLFSKLNILGTVSETSGVPTGAIIEQGSNANGQYVRFADGTQICFDTRLSSAAGASAWTFPVTFVDTDIQVLITPGGTLPRFVGVSALFATSTSFDAWASDGTTRVAINCRMIAIGRWF
jgi:hypothetical protein